MPRFGLHPNLGLHCLKANLMPLFELRLAMSRLAPDGKLPHATLANWWKQQGRSESDLRNKLAAGQKRGWWCIANDRKGHKAIWYVKQAKIADKENVEPTRRRVDFPPELLGGRVMRHDFKAQVYARCMFYDTARKAKERSRAYIESVTGLTAPTQRLYEKQAQVRVATNYYDSHTTDPAGLNSDIDTGWFEYQHDDGHKSLVKQMSNSYQLSTAVQNWRVHNPTAHRPVGKYDATLYRRRYFSSEAAYLKTRPARRADVCFIRQMQDRTGKWLWDCIRTNPNVSVLGVSLKL